MENENRLVKAKEVEEIFNYEVSVAEKDPLDAFDSAILNAATVDAREVVHGQWINRVDNSTDMHECSVCGARTVKGLYEYENPNLYCYHCGSKMDGDTYDSRASG